MAEFGFNNLNGYKKGLTSGQKPSKLSRYASRLCPLDRARAKDILYRKEGEITFGRRLNRTV